MATARKPIDAPALAKIVQNAYSVNLFGRKCGDTAKEEAQKNLNGLTHYVDDGTLKLFHCRILSVKHSCAGLILGLIESAPRDHRNKSRGFRFVAFDVFGNSVMRQDIDSLFASAKEAERAYYAWLDFEFDLAAHYKKIMQRDIAAAKEKAKRLAMGMKNIRT